MPLHCQNKKKKKIKRKGMLNQVKQIKEKEKD